MKETSSFLKSSQNPYNKIIKQGEMLKFNSINHLIETMTKLEQDYETWNDKFESDWGHLDIDAYNDKADELGFDEDQPLRDFELASQHISLRKRILQAEEAWLQNSNLDVSKDPNDDTTIDSPFFQVLFNSQGELRINDSIYVEKPYAEQEHLLSTPNPNSRVLVLIPNGNLTTLHQIRTRPYLTNYDFVNINGSQGFLHTKATIITDNTVKALLDCKWWMRKADFKTYDNGTKRFKFVTKIRNYGIYVNIAARTTSYKRRDNNNGWKKFKNPIYVRLAGVVHAEDCSLSSPLSYKQKEKTRKTVYVSMVHPITYARVKKPYDVWSLHKCENGAGDWEVQYWGIFW